MKSFSTQKPSIKEKASAFCGNVVFIDSIGIERSRDALGLSSEMNNNIREFRVPVEALRSFRFTPRFMVQSKEEELLLRLSELFFFLRRLELDLVDLCLKDSVLADEVTELKCVAREALTYFHEAAQSVEPPFQPSGNDFPESVDESQDNCGANRDGDSFNDVGSADFSEHGKECTR